MTAEHARSQAEIRLTLALAASVVAHALLVALAHAPAGAPVRSAQAAELRVTFDVRPRQTMPSADVASAGPAPSSIRPRHGAGAAALAGFAPALPHYYTAAQLDQRPRPLTPIALPEPADRLAAAYVVVRLRIAETGVVDEATVLVDDAPERMAAEIAAVFGAARYAPGVRRGQAVKSELLIEVKVAPAG